MTARDRQHLRVLKLSGEELELGSTNLQSRKWKSIVLINQ